MNRLASSALTRLAPAIGLTVVFAILGSLSLAKIGPDVDVRLLGPPRLAESGKPFQAQVEIVAGTGATVSDIRFERPLLADGTMGQGPQVLVLDAPHTTDLKQGESIQINFQVVLDPAEPLTLAFEYDGLTVKKSFDLSYEHYKLMVDGAPLLENLDPQELAESSGLIIDDGTSDADPLDLPISGASRTIRVHGRLRYLQKGTCVDTDFDYAPDACSADLASPCGHCSQEPLLSCLIDAECGGGNTCVSNCGDAYIGADKVTVRVKDDIAGLPNTTFATTKTNSLGYFDVSFTASGSPDIYVQFETKNGSVEVQSPTWEEYNYKWRTAPHDGYSGSDLFIGWPVVDKNREAVELHNNVTRAARWYYYQEGIWTPKVQAEWPYDDSISHYSPSAEEIHITSGAAWEARTHLHEWGHHWRNMHTEPVYGDYCNYQCDNDGCGHCMFCGETEHIAMEEGMPNWLADVIIRSHYSDYGHYALSGGGHDLESTPVAGACGGCDCPADSTEGFVSGLLRDIEDTGFDFKTFTGDIIPPYTEQIVFDLVPAWERGRETGLKPNTTVSIRAEGSPSGLHPTLTFRCSGEGDGLPPGCAEVSVVDTDGDGVVTINRFHIGSGATAALLEIAGHDSSWGTYTIRIDDLDDGEADYIADELGLGADEILDVIVNDWSPRPQDFIVNFMSRYPQHVTGLWSTATNIGYTIVDDIPPQNPLNLISTSHSIGDPSSNPSITFEWTPGSDDISGVRGYTASLSQGGPADPGNYIGLGATSTVTMDTPGPGTYYFNIRTVDRAWNWAPGYVSYGPIEIIPPCNLTVTAPNGGEAWRVGTRHDITWTCARDVGTYGWEPVQIELYKGGVYQRGLGATMSNSEFWTIQDTLVPGSDYQVRVYSTDWPQDADYSDGYFTIEPDIVDHGDGTISHYNSCLMWLQDAGQAGSTMTWENAAAWARDLDFAGHTDWRLPTGRNPDGTVCNSASSGGTCIYTELGTLYHRRLITVTNPDPFTMSYWKYWTATPLPGLATSAMVQDMLDGGQNDEPKSNFNGAWAVRTIPACTPTFPGIVVWPDADSDGFVDGDDCDDTDPAISPLEAEVCDDFVDNNCDGQIDELCGCGSGLIDNGDGTITESSTCLMWAKDFNTGDGQYDWQGAMDAAANLDIGGHTDWRLPDTAVPDATCDSPDGAQDYNCTGSEMGHLHYVTLGNQPMLEPQCTGPFLNYDGGWGGRRWSRTTNPNNTSKAFVFFFEYGYQGVHSKIISDPWQTDGGSFIAVRDDENCDGDADSDGYHNGVDCDDSDSTVYPGATEQCDGKDNDCDGPADEDFPTLGVGCIVGYGECETFGTVVCDPPGGVTCDAVPGTPSEELCDGLDNNCNGTIDEGAVDQPTWFHDVDGDGYGGPEQWAGSSCTQPPGAAGNSSDCDDNQATVNPSMPEIGCDGWDNDCNPATPDLFDGDGDGLLCDVDCDDLISTCTTDCADGNGNGLPDCAEPLADADGDSYLGSEDCDDGDPNNWSSCATCLDADTDGYFVGCDAYRTIAGPDCDDADSSNHPGNYEICDGADNNCDGLTDEDWLLVARLTDPDRSPGGEFGTAVAQIDDVDGDEVKDVIVGARYDAPSGSPAVGVATIFSGATRQLIHTLTHPTGEAGDGFGGSAIRVDDVNGDGIDDIVVGASFDNSSAGSAFVFSGSSAENFMQLYELADPTAGPGERFGYSLGAIGDVDGDLVADLVVGARGGDGGRGSVSVFSAATGTFLRELTDPQGDAGDLFGYSVAGIDDVDGDGVGDILVGAYGSDSPLTAAAGVVLVFSGSSGGLTRRLYDTSGAAGDEYGRSTISTADIDGDGIDDILVGVPGYDDPVSGDDAGSVLAYSGASFELLGRAVDPDGASGDHLGYRLASLEDVDGDGVPDFIATAPDDDTIAGAGAGSASIFSGATLQTIRKVYYPDGAGTDALGISVAGLEDVDGDSIADILLGAFHADVSPGDNSGGAYIFSGAAQEDGDTDGQGNLCDTDDDADGFDDQSDCLPQDPDSYPGAVELCDGVDNDCDAEIDEDAVGATTWYRDVDGDGYGDPAQSVLDCLQPADYVTDNTDCDDSLGSVNPAAEEVCADGIDNDCDGNTDDNGVGAGTWYADADSDGYGDSAVSTIACSPPAGFVSVGTDCDDTNFAIRPGVSEQCGDGIDNNCDGGTDDATTGHLDWHADADLDGYGDSEVSVSACAQPAGYVLDGTDCDDGDPQLQACDLPPSPDPVPVPGPGVTLIFPNITGPGDIDITVEQTCDQNRLDGITSNCPDAPCVDVQTTARWDGLVEVCISFDAAGCADACGLRMVACEGSLPTCQPLPEGPNDDACNGVVCGLTEHFSYFGVGVTLDSDSDYTADLVDNCPDTPNMFQYDEDQDGHGDDCDCQSGDPMSYPGAVELCDGVDNDCDDVVDEDCLAACDAPGTPGEDIPVSQNSAASGVASMVWTGSEYGVAWHDDRHASGDSNWEIYFARLDASGARIGPEVRVTTDTGISSYPKLAWNGGQYGLAWRDDRDGNHEIYFTRLDALGNKIGPDRRITEADGASGWASLVWNGREYGLAWHDERMGNREIYFTRLQSTGNKMMPDVRISDGAGTSTGPSLVWTGEEYGVAWHDDRVGDYEIYFARIANSGTKIGSDVRVTAASGESSHVALTWSGSTYGLAWHDYRDYMWEIYFARLLSSGTKIGSDVRLTNDAEVSGWPDVVWGDGEFGVFWHDYRDGTWEIYHSVVDPHGVPVISEIRLTYLGTGSYQPWVLWNGSNFALVWHDDRDGNLEIYFNEVWCCLDADIDTFSVCDSDCNDDNDAVYPGASEICDLVDNDCDGQIDEGYSSPGAVPWLRFESDKQMIMWEPAPAADRYDVVRGDLTALRLSLGDFLSASIECAAEDAFDTMAPLTGDPNPGEVYFYLVRAQRDCKDGTFNSEPPDPFSNRDVELPHAAGMCN